VTANEAAICLSADSFMKQFGVDLNDEYILRKKYNDVCHSIGASMLASSVATLLSLCGVDKYKLTTLVLAARYTDMCLMKRHVSVKSVSKCMAAQTVIKSGLFISTMPVEILICEIVLNILFREYPSNWAFQPFLIAYTALMPSVEGSTIEKSFFNEALAFFSGLSMVQGLVR
jgi:hypothetical protein